MRICNNLLIALMTNLLEMKIVLILSKRSPKNHQNFYRFQQRNVKTLIRNRLRNLSLAKTVNKKTLNNSNEKIKRRLQKRSRSSFH